MSTSDSYFDGGLGGLIINALLAGLLTLFTLGFGFPWALCMRERWMAKHTVIEGKRLRFTGTGGGLIGTWIKIFLLTIITLGIYGLWAGLAIKKWKAEHTRFEA
jgi:uncharacterized membrane protein YjgN (DUF898 family)